MAYYMLQVAYTPEAWRTLTANPVDRTEAIRPVLERLGGTIEHSWMCFGEYDFVLICQMPGNVDAAGFAIAAAAGGALKAIKTTPLLTTEEGLAAMRRAAESGYRPPGG